MPAEVFKPIDDIWGFLDNAPSSRSLRAVSNLAWSGPRIIHEIMEAPIIEFQGFSIDFSSDFWDFTSATELNVASARLRIRFPEIQLKNPLKVFLLNQITSRTAKLQTLIGKTGTLIHIMRSGYLNHSGCPSLINSSDITQYVNLRQTQVGSRSIIGEIIAMRDFLTFYDKTFEPIADTSLLEILNQYGKRLNIVICNIKGTPRIPEEYLTNLISVCQTIIRSSSEPQSNQITAATLLILSQTGLRISELLACKTESLQVLPGHAGFPDIAYMKYFRTKGTKEDNRYSDARTILNPIALEAYRWLEKQCRQHRQRLEADTLIVYPKQKNRYCNAVTFLTNELTLFASHADEFKARNTQNKFPELHATEMRKAFRRLSKEQRKGLRPDDILVYPATHQFRSTVATSMLEQGVDPHFIQEHLGHSAYDITTGYFKNDQDVNRRYTETVYRCIVEDGAKPIGPHADEFMARIQAFIDSEMSAKVVPDVETLESKLAHKFPLIKKVGGMCIRCGAVMPCEDMDETNKIYCAFRICPNQCIMYFMADDTLDALRVMQDNYRRNVDNGFQKAAECELRKLQWIARDELIPEINAMDQQLKTIGRDRILQRFPNLAHIIDNEESIRKEVEEWLSK